LGLYHRARQEYEQALAVCEESAAIFEEIGNELMHSYAVRASAKTQMRMGQTARALPRLEWALSVARRASDRWGQAATLLSLAQLHLAEGSSRLAQSCLDVAMSMWDQMEAPLWRARTLLERARVLHTMGHPETAAAAYTAARKVFHHHGSREDTELPQELTMAVFPAAP
jgi:predicted negative regulator of RcsB-dependent stress response